MVFIKKFLYRIGSIENIASIFMIVIFSLSSLTFFNMFFCYIGLEEVRTELSVALFVILDFILGLKFIKVARGKYRVYIIAALAILLVYMVPVLACGGILDIAKFIILVLPFSLIAYISSIDDLQLGKFFQHSEKLINISAVLALCYVIIIFIPVFFKVPSMEIPEMTYGNIAWLFIPYLLLGIFLYCGNLCKGGKVSNKSDKVKYFLKIALLTGAINFTGLRTGIITIVLALLIAAFLVLLGLSYGNLKVNLVKLVAIACIIIFITGISYYLSPEGSRLQVVKDNGLNEYNYHDSEAKNDEISNTVEGIATEVKRENAIKFPENSDFREIYSHTVYDTKSKKFTSIDQLFINAIYWSSESEASTIEKLHKDIVEGTGNYIIVDSEHIEFASSYAPHHDRLYLWKAAINEFKKSPVVGNGILHFQHKYEMTYPHNIILELMSDFGIIGLFFSLGITLILLSYDIRYIIKNKKIEDGILLAFAISYIPSFLLYTSLYNNTCLLFLVTVITLLFIKYKKYNKEKA